jgi:hypothetical protein
MTQNKNEDTHFLLYFTMFMPLEPIIVLKK